MKLLLATIALCFSGLTAHELVPIGYTEVETQCPGGCCPPSYGYGVYPQQYQQRPNVAPAPDGVQTPPVGAPGTPEFLPSPPQPVNPPITPPQPPANNAELEKQQQQIVTINQQITNLIAKVEAQKPCDLTIINAQLAALQQTVIELQKQLDAATHQPEVALDYDVIAAEVGKRLTHSAKITLLDGRTKTQIAPLGEPLEFIQHPKGIK